MSDNKAADLKVLKARCPKADHEMIVDEDTGIHLVRSTNLAPIFMLETISEKGWNRGEVHGMNAKNARQVVDKGYGMELVGVDAMVGKPTPQPEKARQPAHGKDDKKHDPGSQQKTGAAA